jgi:AcrR family transcriptional regulator
MARSTKIPRKEEILATALKRFAKYGYAATSTRQICADMGLAHSAIYNHYKSKEDLLIAIEEREVTTMQAGLEATMEAERDSSPRRRAYLAIRFTLQRTIASREAWTLSIEAIRSFRPKNRAAAIRRRDKYEQSMKAIIEEALRAEGKPTELAGLWSLFFFGVCDGIARWFSPSGRLTEEELIDEATRWIMRGLQLDPAD